MLKRVLSFLSLFSSLGTLVCCALPALFVSLGLGATLVSLLGTFPQLIWLSEHKIPVFVVAGVLLGITGVIQSRANVQCPIDPKLAAHCRSVKKTGLLIYYFSVSCYVIGGFFAFIAPLLF